MSLLTPKHPKVFVSYSHDSPEHMERVLQLSDRLRREGVDCHIDQYETSPPEGWPRWMANQIQEADFVLVVCTEQYERRFAGREERGRGLGAKWEGAILTQELYDAEANNTKFIPVILRSEESDHIPIILRGATHYCLETEASYEDLYRRLTNQPRIVKPEFGKVVSMPQLERRQNFLAVPWNAPYIRNPFFTGRDDYLRKLRHQLTSSRRAALTGLGGVGKTQIAIEYAYRYRDEYKAVLWTGASSRAALVSGFVSIAELLDLPGKNLEDQRIAVESVKRWLVASSDWLLILDNLDDLTLGGQFIPPAASGHMLLTTQVRSTGAVAVGIDVLDMPPREEGALLLLRRAKILAPGAALADAPELERNLATQISKEMGGLPLALDQAGAFIEETPSTLAEYLQLYKAEGTRLRAARGSLSVNHPESVTVTFSLSFEKVVASNPAAAELLRLCAFLNPEAIPEEILTEGGPELGDALGAAAANPLALATTVKEACRYSFLTRDPGAKTLSIHRLAQAVLNDGIKSETKRLWAERCVRAVDRAFPHPEVSTWPACERLIPHVLVCGDLIEEYRLGSAEAGRLLIQAAAYLMERARLTEAEMLCRRGLKIMEKALGPEHPAVTISLSNLGVLYHLEGKYAEAEPLLRRTLKISEKLLGPEDQAVATSLNGLGVLYCAQGKYAKAKWLHRRALKIREKLLGPEDLAVATSLDNLAVVYHAQGKYAEAEPLGSRGLKIKENLLGPEHPEVAKSLDTLAVLYAAQGRYAEAKPLLRRGLKIKEKLLGPAHPELAKSLDELAALYVAQGRYAEAKPLLRRGLKIKEKLLGPAHPELANSLNNLAMLYAVKGQYAKADTLLQRAVAIWEKTTPDHPSLLCGLMNYADLLLEMKRDAAARKIVARVREIGAEQQKRSR